MKKLLALAVLALPVLAFARAGNEGGNGGNAVVCKDSSGAIVSAELLDYYEARVQRGFTIDLGAKDDAVDKKVALVFSRLAKFRPARAARLAAAAENFQENANFLAGVDLPPVEDSFNMILPAGCELAQTAIQKTPEFPEDKIFIINKNIWDHLDNDSRAGLILHEIFYREALTNPAVVNSVEVRYYNAYLASTKFQDLSATDFDKLDAYVPWLALEIMDAEFLAAPTQYDANCVTPLHAGETLTYLGQTFHLGMAACDHISGTTVGQIGLATTVHLVQQGDRFGIAEDSVPAAVGQATYVTFKDQKISAVSGISSSVVVIGGKTFAISGGADLYPSGHLSDATSSATSVQLGANDLSLGGTLWWSDDGVLTRSYLAKDATLKVGAQSLPFAASEIIDFDAAGNIVDGQLSQTAQIKTAQGPLSVSGRVEFYSNGSLSEAGYLEDSAWLKDDHGRAKLIKKGASGLDFDEKGALTSFSPKEKEECTIGFSWLCIYR